MNEIFADTNYWIARVNVHDQWYDRVIEVEQTLGAVNLVTTESVLIELLNFFAEYPARIRQTAVAFVYYLLDDLSIEVLPHTRATFLAGLELYEARLDKGYSLTDCISMNVMREREINEILTHDHHFAQEGFTVLL